MLPAARLSPHPVVHAQVKDVTSDMAVISKKGSDVLRAARERRERNKMRKRFWELGGTRMGDAMGVAKPVEEEDDKGPQAKKVGGKAQSMDDDEVDFREENK